VFVGLQRYNTSGISYTDSAVETAENLSSPLEQACLLRRGKGTFCDVCEEGVSPALFSVVIQLG
jgi:hypothetical protein